MSFDLTREQPCKNDLKTMKNESRIESEELKFEVNTYKIKKQLIEERKRRRKKS